MNAKCRYCGQDVYLPCSNDEKAERCRLFGQPAMDYDRADAACRSLFDEWWDFGVAKRRGWRTKMLRALQTADVVEARGFQNVGVTLAEILRKEQTVSDSLTNEEIVAAIVAAFLPNKTVVEFWDYGARLRYQVRTVAEDQVLYTQPDLLVRLCRNREELSRVIDQSQQETLAKSTSAPAPCKPAPL